MVFIVVQTVLAYIQGRVCSPSKLGTRVGSLRSVIHLSHPTAGAGVFAPCLGRRVNTCPRQQTPNSLEPPNTDKTKEAFVSRFCRDRAAFTSSDISFSASGTERPKLPKRGMLGLQKFYT